MPVGLFRAGKNSRVIVEDAILNKSKWHTDIHGDDIDDTNFESGGVDQGLIGITGVSWDIGGLWDAGANNFEDPPGLYPRDNLGAINLYENLSDNVFWDLPINRVLSSKNGAEVRQAVTFESSGKLNGGPFFLPGGTEWSNINNDEF